MSKLRAKERKPLAQGRSVSWRLSTADLLFGVFCAPLTPDLRPREWMGHLSLPEGCVYTSMPNGKAVAFFPSTLAQASPRGHAGLGAQLTTLAQASPRGYAGLGAQLTRLPSPSVIFSEAKGQKRAVSRDGVAGRRCLGDRNRSKWSCFFLSPCWPIGQVPETKGGLRLENIPARLRVLATKP